MINLRLLVIALIANAAKPLVSLLIALSHPYASSAHRPVS